jgi:hypothetical protein
VAVAVAPGGIFPQNRAGTDLLSMPALSIFSAFCDIDPRVYQCYWSQEKR